jgi:hypothetical protein
MGNTINFSDATPAAPTNPPGGNVKWQNDTSNPPNISAYMPTGVGGGANIVAKSILTAQSAAIVATTIFAVPSGSAGLYRVSFVATITTAGTTSALGGTTGFQLKYTNGNGDGVVKTEAFTSPSISAGNTTGTSISGNYMAYCAASTNLQYLFGYTSTGTVMAYDLAIFAEFLGS